MRLSNQMSLALSLLQRGESSVTPSDLSTAFWFDVSDASTVTKTGSLVDQLDDKSGNDNHLIGTTTTRPTLVSAGINSLDSIRFSGAEYLKTSAAIATVSQPCTWFMSWLQEAKPGSSSDYDLLIDAHPPGSNRHQIRYRHDNDIEIAASTLNTVTRTTDPPSVHVLTATVNGASSRVWFDGTDLGTFDLGTSDFTGLVVGASFGLASRFLNGEKGEWGLVNEAITESTALGLHLGIAQKWIDGFLPIPM